MTRPPPRASRRSEKELCLPPLCLSAPSLIKEKPARYTIGVSMVIVRTALVRVPVLLVASVSSLPIKPESAGFDQRKM